MFSLSLIVLFSSSWWLASLKVLPWTWYSNLFISSHCFTLSKLSRPIPPGCPQTPNSPHSLLFLADQFCPLYLISSVLLSPCPFLIPLLRITHCFPICAMNAVFLLSHDFFPEEQFVPTPQRKSFFNINSCLCAPAYTVPSAWNSPHTPLNSSHGPHILHKTHSSITIPSTWYTFENWTH